MRRQITSALIGVGVALPLVLWLWDFMVDDALISARYAANIAAGHGYRFNARGPISDGVTPLGWAYLLAPFAGGGVLDAWRAAKWIGLVSWLVGAGAIGIAIDALDGGRLKWGALVLMGTLTPLAAWSVAGMETGLVLGLASLAVCARVCKREWAAVALAGLVAGLRPEALPWALALALSPTRGQPFASRWQPFVVALAPFMLAGAVRLVVFGRFAPLALIAKPSSLTHGAMYAAACALLTGSVALCAIVGLPRWVRGLQAAALAHLLAMVVAGGDWMPLARLSVVALPTTIVAAAYIAGHAKARWSLPRLALALAGTLYQLITVAPRAADVGHKRMAVIEQLRPALQDAAVIACVDAGWVGAASSATIVDLAGVTDPAIAVLPGGHTTKPIPHALFDARGVDTLVLLLADEKTLASPWTKTDFARWVEFHVADMPAMAETYDVAAISEGRLIYVVLRRRRGDS
jgi:hypothetical protein